MIQKLRQKSRNARKKKWGLAFIETPLDQILCGVKPKIRWVHNPYTDRWFADPFILSYNNSEINLLVEEFSYNSGVGRIARVTVNRKTMSISGMKILLELPTHLSFPFIIRQNGKILVMPENFHSGKQAVYEYDARNDSLVWIREIYSGQLTDAIHLNAAGAQFVWSTEVPGHNGSQLKIFSCEDNTLKQLGCVSFPGKTARNAGAIFEVDGKLYRPAQVCDKSYGSAVEIQQVSLADTSSPEFTPVVRITPQSRRWSEGLHTFNVLDDLIVIDGLGYRNPLIGKPIASLAAFCRKFKRK